MKYKSIIHLSYDYKLKHTFETFEEATKETEKVLEKLYGLNGDQRFKTLKCTVNKQTISYSIMTREFVTGDKVRRVVATIKEEK